MLTCEMVTVGRPDGAVEWRVAPVQEPLASCAFTWERGWAAAAPPWVPPGLHAAAPLFELRGPAEAPGRLGVWVMRYGVEVDGLEAIRGATGLPFDGPLTAVRWNGLPLVEARAGAAAWAVIHAGPSLFVARAEGAAVALLPQAARSWRGLSGLSPIAEPLTTFELGPLATWRIAAWRLGERLRAPHGHHRATLRLDGPDGSLLARIELLVVDRRVFVGLDPHVAIAAADGRLATLDVTLGARAPDPGPSGPAERGAVKVAGVAAEHRRVVRLIGPSLVVLDGLWRADAPVARLNGRRHQDILLAQARRRD